VSQKSLTGGLLLCLALAARSEAQTVTLQPAADAWVQKSTANQNRGADPTLQLASGDSHILLRFDQAAITAAVGSGRLVSASLELFVHAASGNWGTGGHPVEAHVLTAPWTETGVTWNCAADSNPANGKADCAAQWSGGSSSGDISDSILQTSTAGVWVPFDVTADVAGFLAGTPNQGWLITKEDTAQGGKVDYGSREGAAAERPRLVLLIESAAHDQVPPMLAITSPRQPILVNEPAPAVTVEYADGGSGVDTATLLVRVDGQDVTASCTAGAQSASCRAPNLAAGDHTIQAALKDKAGNAAQASFAFKLLLGPGPHVATFPAVGDTYLRKGDVNKNSGTEPIVRIRESGANRAVVQFDAQSLATTLTGATLVSAALELHIEKNGRNWGKTGRTVDAHRLTSGWTETGATWNCSSDANPTNGTADCAAPWSGGSFAATPTASVLHTRDLTGWVSYDVTADVAAFAAGTADFGWLLKKTDEKKSGRVDYDSREGTAGEGPRLVVVFTTPVDGNPSPPTLSIVAPADELLAGDPIVEVLVLFGESVSGIDAASFTLSVDGVPFQSACALSGEMATCRTPPLATGERLIEASVRDRAGHPASASKRLRLTLDLNPPVLAVLTPLDGSSVNHAAVTVSGTVSDDSAVTSVEVNGSPAAVVEERFSLEVPLQPGSNALLTVATDALGRQSEVLSQVSLDTDPPVIEVESPPAGATSNFASVRVSGKVVDRSKVASFSIAGSPVVVTAGRFATDVALAEGPNVFELRAEDVAGNVSTASIQIARFTLPEVRITVPADLSFMSQTTVDVAGTVNDPSAVVSVNGTAAAVSGTRFIAQGVSLIEGGNVLTATAKNSQGHIATDHVQVVRDTTAPRLAVHFPQEGQEVFEPTVTVSGMVNDIVAGTVNRTEATVSVNGIVAEVGNRSFLARGVPLVPGENVLHVEAVDASGNVGRATAHVTFREAAAARVRRVAGDLQSGVAATLLPLPLRVQLLDAAGLPAGGRPVLFTVEGNDGSLAGGKRQTAVLSDVSGYAETPFRLGTRSGVGSQAVEASAVGFAGPVVFHATALPGNPALIVVDSGDHQVGIAGQTLPRSLVAVVTDSGFNRLPGVAVRFAVVKGEGQLEDGSRQTTVTTDSDGRAILKLRLDAAEGVSNNVVEARIASLLAGPAAGFTATGWAAGDPSATAISGVVLDNSNQPVPGVTLRIKGYPQTAQTNALGTFRIAGAPVGTLYLIVDGSTAESPGSWPDLEFVMTTIAGRDNTLGMPIYLLPLDLANGVLIDETRGGILKLPEVPGFALEIAPGSVTFPSGSRSGVVSVTVVHSDKIPMVPNFGQQPRLIVTIQPAGARFEPPAKLTLPNLEGLAPGAVTELYSFDHDLGHFVSIGPATVSEDGTVITSNPGVGIIKAGWHCGGTPGFTGSSEDCPACYSCILNSCFTDDEQTCSLSDPCKTKARCQGGTCTGEDVMVTSIKGACFGEVGKPVTFTAVSNAPDRLKWRGEPGANPGSGSGPSFTTTFTTEGAKSISAGCPAGGFVKTLKVFSPCAGSAPNIVWNPVSSTPPCFGWTKPIQVISKPKACAGSDNICARLESLQIDYTRAVPAACNIDVPSADAPAVTEAIAKHTCDALISDLEPQPADSEWLGAPKRQLYWVSSITEEHEKFHEDNHLRPLIEAQFIPAALAVLQDERWCGSGCGVGPNLSGLQTEVARIWDETVRTTWDDPTARAEREQEAMPRTARSISL